MSNSVTLPDHFSATISLTISEPQPQYGLVQLTALRGASGDLISCDVNRADFLAVVSEVLNVDIAARKLPEPTGLGAVVEDSAGLTWVRRHPGGEAWVNGYQRWARWDAIRAVRVLSEGVVT